MKVYIDKNDHWVGHYLGPNHHYVCLLPMIVIRWQRKAYRNSVTQYRNRMRMR